MRRHERLLGEERCGFSFPACGTNGRTPMKGSAALEAEREAGLESDVVGVASAEAEEFDVVDP